ncbi:hypothetical protein ABEU20_001263 [Rhodococcus sp. PAM 2766]|uniref:Uncharacterized protein n=1 Tax=Rhodococcus parequi TaxID=3137122 RepID=A0ABW9FBS7_9NOCA
MAMRVAARCLSFAILLATVTLLVYVSQEPPAAPRPADIIWRSALPSCGDAKSRPGIESGEPLSPSVIDCLSGGREREGGEFALTLYTTEGDPIDYYLRAIAYTTDVEVLVDSSQDRFGGGPGWRRITCPIGELSPDLLWDCIAGD